MKAREEERKQEKRERKREEERGRVRKTDKDRESKGNKDYNKRLNCTNKNGNKKESCYFFKNLHSNDNRSFCPTSKTLF